MKHLLTHAELEQLSATVARYLGLHFPPSHWQTLENGLSAAATELEFGNISPTGVWAEITGEPETRLDGNGNCRIDPIRRNIGDLSKSDRIREIRLIRSLELAADHSPR